MPDNICQENKEGVCYCHKHTSNGYTIGGSGYTSNSHTSNGQTSNATYGISVPSSSCPRSATVSATIKNDDTKSTNLSLEEKVTMLETKVKHLENDIRVLYESSNSSMMCITLVAVVAYFFTLN